LALRPHIQMDRRLEAGHIRGDSMTRYYKKIKNGYIIAIGTGGGGTKISESSYNEIMAIIQSKPPRIGNTDYRLTKDLTWEEYERDPDPIDEELSAEEALNVLLGGGEPDAEE